MNDYFQYQLKIQLYNLNSRIKIKIKKNDCLDCFLP